jgi:signal transduction histidine kinase
MSVAMRTALHAQYSAALREYCSKGGAAALSWAFQPSLLGHRAARECFSALEVAAMHQKALVETLLEMLSVDDLTRVAHRASEFVAEALAPFEGEQPALGEREREREREQLEATRHRLDAVRRQLLEQRRAEQRKNEIICVMSHEIHGSLSVLMSELGGESTSHRQKLLDVALRNSERMIRLVEESPAAQVMELGSMFHGSGAADDSEPAS